MGISPHRNTKRARQPEIREFEVVAIIDEQILRFQIAMQNPVRMAVQKARVQLMREFLFIQSEEARSVSCCQPRRRDAAGKIGETRDVMETN